MGFSSYFGVINVHSTFCEKWGRASKFRMYSYILVSNQFMCNRYKSEFVKWPPVVLPAIYTSCFFLMFNKVRFFKHLWLFPFFNSLNLIFSSVVFVQSFLDLGCYLHLPSFPNPTATTFASFPCVLLHEFHLFIFCLCASPSWILLPEKFY